MTFSGLTIIASWAIGLVLFTKKAMLSAFAVWILCVLGITIAEQTRLLPYWPLVRDAPFHDPSHDDGEVECLTVAATRAAAPPFPVTAGAEGDAYEIG